jgi:hypothetical protein
MNINRLRIIEEQRCKATGEPPLQIFEKEIMAFAINQFYQDTNGKGRWNGRQIRNAFQVAASLAYDDARKKYNQLKGRFQDTQPLRPKLDVRHFDMTHTINDSFDHYMRLAIGKNDAELEYEASERADHFKYRNDSHENLENYGTRNCLPEWYRSDSGTVNWGFAASGGSFSHSSTYRAKRHYHPSTTRRPRLHVNSEYEDMETSPGNDRSQFPPHSSGMAVPHSRTGPRNSSANPLGQSSYGSYTNDREYLLQDRPSDSHTLRNGAYTPIQSHSPVSPPQLGFRPSEYVTRHDSTPTPPHNAQTMRYSKADYGATAEPK